jgi:hypothetical protein
MTAVRMGSGHRSLIELLADHADVPGLRALLAL